jgi:spectinomycin phosphotransferase
MLEPLSGLAPETIVTELRRSYGITGVDAGDVVFVPLGEDSWCYRVRDWWVSVRRDLRGHVPQAYELASQLREGGLRFVLAPTAATDGRVVATVGGRPLVVFPYRDAAPLSRFRPSAAQLAEVRSMISEVHSSATDVDLPMETFELSFDDELDAAVGFASGPPRDRGPYSGRLHTLLCRHRDTVDVLRAEAACLAVSCRRDRTPFVVTHGEPSAPNILHDGEMLLLADWGGAMWGPPERDWFNIGRTLELTPPGRDDVLRFYATRWRLSEIAEYTAHFRAEHHGGADDDAMWRRLLRYLPD